MIPTEVSLVARHVFAKFAKDAGVDLLRTRMERSVISIAKGMDKKGMTPGKVSREVLVRDALFRLIRSVIPSGDLSDFLRDQADDQVFRKVDVALPDTATLPELIRATRDAYLSLVFG